MISFKARAFFLAAGASLVATPMVAATAPAQTRSQDDYARDDQARYDDQARDNDQARYDDPQDSQYYDEQYDRAAPPGYDGTQPPPPPRGWQADPEEQRYLADDDRFADQAERWSQANCVKSRDNTGVGAVVGGLIGALVGNSASRPRDRTGGTLAGAAIGAAGGAVIGSASSNQTSPGCPPGFVVRGGAAQFSYGQGYAYGAPGWYRPWVFVGSRWIYRPYPYHRFYARHYARPYGFRRGPGYRRGPGPRARRW